MRAIILGSKVLKQSVGVDGIVSSINYVAYRQPKLYTPIANIHYISYLYQIVITFANVQRDKLSIHLCIELMNRVSIPL